MGETMTDKHAPGPWTIVAEDHRTGELYVRNRAGLIAGRGVPYRYQGQDERHAVEMAEYRANAHLISACPDMLEALLSAEEIIVALIGMHGDGGAGLVLKQVRAAISKAKGETT